MILKKNSLLLIVGVFVLILIFPNMIFASADECYEVPYLIAAEGENPPTTTLCKLGLVEADACVYIENADIAILPGEDMYANLLPGTRSQGEIEHSFINDSEICLVEVSASEIKEILECGVACLTLNDKTKQIEYSESEFDGYPQISGFSYEVDLPGKAGSRIMRITLEDGTKLDLNDNETTYTLATTEKYLDGTYGYKCKGNYKKTGHTESDVMEKFLNSGVLTSKYEPDGAVTYAGTTSYSIASSLKLGPVAGICVLIVAFFSLKSIRVKEKLYL